MILPALALLSVSIDGGPLDKVLAHLTAAVKAADSIEILYGFDDVGEYKSAGVKCQRCTLEQIMTQVLAGTSLFWGITDNDDDKPGIVIVVCMSAADCEPQPAKPCRPELGARAPLPPCSPKSLALGVTEL